MDLQLTGKRALVTGAAVTRGDVSEPVLLLFLGCIAWVIGYDTIYAHQDKEDDAIVGVKSTALMFGAATKQLFGSTIVDVRDQDGDGVDDFVVGAPFAQGSALGSGQVYVRSGANGASIFVRGGDAAQDFARVERRRKHGVLKQRRVDVMRTAERRQRAAGP